MPLSCPLCHSNQVVLFHQDKKRHYYRCDCCQLVSVPATEYVTELAEKAVYDLHDNDCADAGYRRFLGRTWQPLAERLSVDKKGLDYGCGEGAVLSLMAQEQGYQVANYDLFYHPNKQVLACQYDFVTMTEVIEHIADAKKIWQQLDSLLVAGGTLAIMTKMALDKEAFARWHYINDPTHINFYSIATFEWLAKQMNWQLEVIANDVVFFSKP